MEKRYYPDRARARHQLDEAYRSVYEADLQLRRAEDALDRLSAIVDHAPMQRRYGGCHHEGGEGR
jgi:hypothetical protein